MMQHAVISGLLYIVSVCVYVFMQEDTDKDLVRESAVAHLIGGTRTNQLQQCATEQQAVITAINATPWP